MEGEYNALEAWRRRRAAHHLFVFVWLAVMVALLTFPIVMCAQSSRRDAARSAPYPASCTCVDYPAYRGYSAETKCEVAP